MACACGKKNNQMQYVYTSPGGQKKVYKTEIEARAAQIRQGGTYTSQPVR